MEKIQSVTIELRPRLQICNAFIHLIANLQPNEVEIKVSEKYITLVLQNKSINLPLKHIKLMPLSMSTLNVVNNWISFRVQTQSDPSFGSFKTEVLNSHVPLPLSLSDSINKKHFNSSECIIICSCCKNVISKNIVFKRIMALPDVDCDPSEWFCCNHSHKNIPMYFSPQISDLFYGPFFLVVNSDIFTNSIRIKSNVLICNRCFQYLGKKYSDNAYKLWSSAVEHQSLDQLVICSATDPLNDFFAAFQSSVTGIFGEEVVLCHITKERSHYLLIKPMDWGLNLIIESNSINHNDSINLEELSVVKVLYKYGTERDDVTGVSLNIKFCEVSLHIIEAGFKYLLSSTKRFPEAHRFTSGYYIGHMQLIKGDSKS